MRLAARNPGSRVPTPPSVTGLDQGPPDVDSVRKQLLAKAGVVDAVVVLKSPKLEGDRLTFDVDLLEGDLTGGDGAVSVFMDIINLPIARRTSHKGAWYAGAP